MIIRKPPSSLSQGSATNLVDLSAIKSQRLKRPLLLILCIFILAGLTTFFISAVYLKGWNVSNHFTKIHKETIRRKLPFLFQPYRWIMSHFPSSTQIPRLYIDIKFKEFQKISKAKARGWKAKTNFSRPDDWVSAKITYNGEVKKVKLRLKGKTVNHMIGDKWSYRINIKDGASLFGMRRIIIQNPKTRNYESEILFFHALKREGIVAPRYFFTNVTINGKDIGVMALEEHMGKELLESQNRKEAPIIRFDDDLFYQAYYQHAPFQNVFRNYKALPLRIIGSNPKKKSKDFQTYLKIATGLLRGFVEGKIPASSAFDTVLTGRYLAVSRVWGAEHSLEVDDVRFYYNPITAKLELVGHDGKVLKEGVQTLIYPDNRLITHLLSDPEIRFHFSKTLQRLHEEFQDGITLEWVQKIQDKNLKILQREFYSYEGLNLDEIKRRASVNYKADQGLFSDYPSHINAHYIEGIGGKGFLEIANLLPNLVDVNSIKVTNRLTGKEEQSVLRFPEVIPLVLEATRYETSPRIRKIILNKNYDIKDYNIEISSSVRGTATTMIHEVISYYPVLKSNPIPARSINQILSDFPFITKAGPGTLLMKEGRWNIDDWLFVPQNFELIIQEGTLLKFASSVGIISKGRLMIDGTTDNPVVLRGNDETDLWQGIAVLNTKEPSVWSNATIKNTTGIKLEEWSLTAGTTFYQADVVLNNVLFSGNLCEDSLNIIRSNFELNEVSIKNALSDGFDSDFSKGVVSKGTFENIGLAGGGDAIDVSGTTIKIRGTEFKHIGDKAISAGENSTVTGSKLIIDGAVAGIVSKDGSHVFLEDVSISGFKVASMMTYIKKQEYGPATIIASNIKTGGIPDSVIAEKRSQILIDGLEVLGRELDVKQLYSTTMKPTLK
jgi:hypothetical protein